MPQYYFEDERWPWRPDGFLRKHTKQRRKKQVPRFARDDTKRTVPRALDLGMGYGRNALWLAEQGYEVEGWEIDRRCVAEARREARRRGIKVRLRHGDFTRVRFRGLYDLIVISNALHQVRRSAALRVLRQARKALAPGGQIFLLFKLTHDPHFRRLPANPAWQPVRGERHTFRHRGRGWVLSALTRTEVKSALRGLRVRQYREGVYRSRWPEPGGAEKTGAVRHHLAEVVARKPKGRGENRGNE